MFKAIAIILCIFCSFAFVKAQTESEGATQCFVQYNTYNPPDECSTYTDENGETEEVCINNGSAVAAAILNADGLSFAQENFSLQSLSYSGTCNCVLTFYKEGNALGCHVRHRFSGADDGVINADDILVQRANSFRVKCTF